MSQNRTNPSASKKESEQGSEKKQSQKASVKKSSGDSGLLSKAAAALSRINRTGWAVIALVVVVAIAVGLALHHEPDFSAGMAALEELENRDVNDMHAKVTNRRKEEMNEMLESGTFNVSAAMSDAVIIGDSRAEGFGSYQIIDPTRVLATIGERADKISTWKDQVAALQPSTIYISYGGNDLSYNTGHELDPDGYAKLYEKQIDELLEVDPNARIAINSIIEPTPAIAAAEPWWSKRDDFNRQLKELCERRGWVYIDNSSLSDGGNAPIYDADGMHFLASFYAPWAANMTMTVLESEIQ